MRSRGRERRGERVSKTRFQRAAAIADMRESKYREQGGLCYVCHKPIRFAIFQLAHKIPQRKWCIEKWGEEVIHHRRNLVGVCGLHCNGLAQLDPESLSARMLAESIKGDPNGIDEVW
jgi:hypothetical protein